MQPCKLLAKAVLIMLTSMPSSALANKIPEGYHNQDSLVRQEIREHLGDPLMEIIAGCESTGNPKQIKHWEADGSLVKNPNSSAKRIAAGFTGVSPSMDQTDRP